MVMTGVAALRICMKLTLKYKYARLPNPRVAACGRGGRAGEPARRREGEALVGAHHEEAHGQDAADVEVPRHFVLQSVCLEHVDQQRARQTAEAHAQAACGGRATRVGGGGESCHF
jgi:hypothetical protein